jgi:hypothetical protein
MIKMIEDKIKECEAILADPSETDRSFYEGKFDALRWILKEIKAEA